MESASTTARALLQSRTLRVTDGRLRVLATLIEAAAPLSIDAIASRVPSINLVTVYRILDRFVECGIIYRTDFRDRKAFFEYQGAHHHHHITCSACHRRESVDICIGDRTRHITSHTKHFSDVTGHVLEFFGVCHQCKKQRA